MSYLVGEKEYFKGIGKIRYEGAESKNHLAYKWYDENKVVFGKSMKDYFRFAVAYWHSLCGTGGDPFGPGTKRLEWNESSDAVARGKQKMDAAFELVHEFEYPAATVIKHTNPCGAAVGKSAEEALEKAYNADPMSAFGCIIALNRGCTKACAEFLKDKFIEVIVAPSFDDDAKAILSSKKSLRLMETGPLEKKKASRLTLKKISGGLLVQSKSFPQIRLDIEIIDKLPTRDDFNELLMAWKKDMAKPWQRFFCVTKRKPAKEELADLIFAWKVNKHVKSNAVLYAKGLVTVGIGAGQMSRVDSTIIASQKAGDRAKGAAMSSDAFFPFRDGIDEAAKVGITSIIQPGGSIRDKEAIEAADQHSMAMLFTGIRLFKH